MMKNHNSLKNRGIRIICIGLFSTVFSLSAYSLLSSNHSQFDVTRLYNFAIAVIILIMVSLTALGYGSYLVIRSEALKPKPTKSHLGYVSWILTQKSYSRIFVISSIIYGIFFGFLSQILIYHMDVEGDSAPTIYLTLCCNYPGYVPMITAQITEQFSIFIIPINVILAIVVSVLVGINFALSVYFLKMFGSQSHRKFSVASIFGGFGGLFIGCPTCAGSLFTVFVGFSASTALSVLAPLQSLFIAISVPILVVMPLLIVRKMKNETCGIVSNQ